MHVRDSPEFYKTVERETAVRSLRMSIPVRRRKTPSMKKTDRSLN